MKPSIRQCRAADVAALDMHNPSPSASSFHAQRFQRHSHGTSTYLVAFRAAAPVGHAEISWDGCAAAHVRDAHPHCPEVGALEVFPASLRGRGIGSALIACAENLAAGRGYRHLGLGVAHANPAARRLYERLGYVGGCDYLDRYACLDSFGTWHRFSQECVFLTKLLPRRISPRPWSRLLAPVTAAMSPDRHPARRHM